MMKYAEGHYLYYYYYSLYIYIIILNSSTQVLLLLYKCPKAIIFILCIDLIKLIGLILQMCPIFFLITICE